MFTFTSELSPLALPATTLAAAFFGSTHCLAMCGGIAATAGTEIRGLMAYQLGRLLAYVALGATAGAFGAGAIDLLQGTRWTWPLAFVFCLLSLTPAIALWRGTPLSLRVGGGLSSWLWKRAPSRLRNVPFTRSLLLGLMTPLLPCGWLYSFALVAAGTGEAGRGALVLGALWAGSLPSLLLAPALVVRWKDRLNGWNRRAVAMVLIAVMLANLATKMGAFTPSSSSPKNAHSCH